MLGHRTRVPTLGRHGRYRLLQRIGEDAIGSLWRGMDGAVARPVTLRVLRDELGAHHAFLRALRDELRSVSPRLEHPNVGAVISHHTDVDEGCFIVMRAFQGQTLARRLQEGPLDAVETARIAASVWGALSAAHAHGIVHGAVSPHSVLLGTDGVGRLIDFGIPAALWHAARQAPRATLDAARDRLGELADRKPGLADDVQSVVILTEQMRSNQAVAVASASTALVELVLATLSDLVPSPRPKPAQARLRARPGPHLPVVNVRSRVRTARALRRRAWGVTRSVRRMVTAVSRATAAVAAVAAAVPRAGRRVVRRITGRIGRASLVGGAAAAIALLALVGAPWLVERPSERAAQPVSSNPSPSPSSAAVMAVPDVGGLSAMQAGRLLGRVGLLVADSEPMPGPPGEVVATHPATGDVVELGTAVVLYVGVSHERLDTET